MKQKVSVLFICHGNICRSPMAEFILKDMVKRAGLEDSIFVASAATSMEEIGNPVYPPAQRILAKHGLHCKGKTARKMTAKDYDIYDLLVYMERYNLRNMLRIVDDPEGKMRSLMSFTGDDEDIEDPWYTGNFSGVYAQIERGCRALLSEIEKQFLQKL